MELAVIDGEDSQNQEILIFKKVHSLAYMLLGNYHDAWDLTQEVFLELEKGRTKWEAARSKYAWAMGVFHRQLKRYLRLKGDRKTHELIEEDASTEDTAEKRAMILEQVTQTFKAVQNLNKDMAEALLLFSLEKMPIKDIAKIQDVPEGTVKWRIFEARRIIATKVQQ